MRLIPFAALLLATTAPAWAQQARPDITPRVDKIERELRAVQRKVFPGGAQQYFEPEITAAAPAQPGGVPASSPVADLTARVASLEQALQQLTGQVEQNSFRLRQIEEQMARMTAAPVAPVTEAPPTPFVTLNPPSAAATPAPAAPTASSRTSSGDAGEDAYMAGYDLWVAKKYPQAAAALKAMAETYPDHRRASFARNLMGRALLDDGQPAKAAEAFYANYQTFPRGERAPDSLYFLGQSLMALKPPKTADACKVYAELIDVYGEKIEQPLKDRIAKGRADAKCG